MDSKKASDYKRAFNAKTYDRIEIVVPKGQKQAIEAHARGKGKTINGLVNDLIKADMGLSEWPEKETQDAGQE